MRIHPYLPSSPFSEINWVIVKLVLAIAGLGLLMMISAGNGGFSPWASHQFAVFAIGFILMIGLAITPMRMLLEYAYIIYFFCILMLLVVAIMGHTGMGAQRWLKVGTFNFQPSEFMKLALIIALARYFHQLQPEEIQKFAFLIPPILMIIIPAALILKEPNLGTATILFTVGTLMCFLAGMPWRYFIIAGVSAVSATPVLWHFMHDYQKRRVLTFLNPDQDPLGAGYNILQSMIAIGSGGFFGKGYLHGSQNQLNFLPEKHTDFIFTMLAEELGFIGGLILLGLYAALLLSGMAVARRSRSTFGAMVAVGITALFFIHILINCGMVMGMMPVVGVPLPLMSYGGSIMMSAMLASGLLLNAYAHRDQMPSRRIPRL